MKTLLISAEVISRNASLLQAVVLSSYIFGLDLLLVHQRMATAEIVFVSNSSFFTSPLP